MNRVTRLLAIAGLGLGAAVAIGAGPAQAATDTTQGTSNTGSTQARGDWDDDEVVGYFRTLGGCERAGRLGEIRDRWDDYDCSRVRWGSHRGAWELEVSTDDWNDGWDNHNWNRGWGNNWHGGSWLGNRFPGRPGFPGFPGGGGFPGGPFFPGR
ncbi:hypothetical protein ACWKSP_12890 [Micromonosporaceae bacterium Da 78-11]